MDWVGTTSYLSGIINNLEELSDPVRIAAFDLDDTLIHRPARGKEKKTWTLLDSSIPDVIAYLVKHNYIIVVFTNQSGMSMNRNFDIKAWKKSVDSLSETLFATSSDKYYFAVYAAKKYDLYRKPNLGLWQRMKTDLKEEFGLDSVHISTKSFFCGDAAGRITASHFKRRSSPTSSKGDFSDTDIKFALNIGIKFLTPEEIFLAEEKKMPYKLTGVDPKELLEKAVTSTYKFKPRKKEMIVMVGLQGSTKTSFVKKYILPHGYVHINQDICKTKAKCEALTKKTLEKGKSVVIDNTNPDVLTRMDYTSMALENGYKNIRAIIMNTDEAIARHLNNVRHVASGGAIPKVTNIAYNIFKKKYVKPQKTEHFDLIENVDFVFDVDQLKDPYWRKIFMLRSES